MFMIFYSKCKLVEDTHLATSADVFVCVLIDKDVDPCIDHGFLQGGAAHPLPCEVSETVFLLGLQHTLVTLLLKFAQTQIVIKEEDL